MGEHESLVFETLDINVSYLKEKEGWVSKQTSKLIISHSWHTVRDPSVVTCIVVETGVTQR